MRIIDWSSDVCSSDLIPRRQRQCNSLAFCRGRIGEFLPALEQPVGWRSFLVWNRDERSAVRAAFTQACGHEPRQLFQPPVETGPEPAADRRHVRSEEHTSELQSLMRSSHPLFSLK